MASSLLVTPHAFITKAEAEAFITKAATVGTPADDAFVQAVNWAAAQLEAWTGRPLRHRNYTPAFSVAAADVNVAGTIDDAGGLIEASGRVHDPVVQTSGTTILAQYSRIAAIAATSSITPVPTGTATVGVRVGSKRLRILAPGEATSDLWFPEWPLNNLYAMVWIGADGAANTLDISDAYIDNDEGHVILVNDVVPAGALAVEASCNCGYQEPSGTTIGHPAAWADLKTASLMFALLYWQTYQAGTGNFDVVSAGQMTANVRSAAIPGPLRAIIDRYKRRTA